jgi:5-methyltetrahydropteroyltriglutamate--homocysteine methyltransferase
VDQVHLTGIFPRPEKLIEVSRRFDRGRADASELQANLTHSARELVDLQVQSEIDLVVDGQLNWQDLFRPFSILFNGIEPGSLSRWFDNNTFYRTPVVTDKVRRSESDIDEYFRHDLLPTSVRRKAILPGPYTFAKLSENDAYGSFADLVEDLSRSLAEVSRKLTQKKYTSIQFNEPSLCTANPEELEIAKRGFEVLAKNGMHVMLQTYFGSIINIIDGLLDFPVDCFGIDLYANDINILNERSFTRELSCGCIDGRNSLLESSAHIVDLMTKVRDSVEPRQLYVGPNCDLEFLPHSVAVRKVHLLGDIRRRLNDE